MENKNSGPDTLRAIVKAMNNTRENLNTQFTAPELVRLYEAMFASGFDLYPDEWEYWQVKEAAKYGKVPQWHSTSRGLEPIDVTFEDAAKKIADHVLANIRANKIYDIATIYNDMNDVDELWANDNSCRTEYTLGEYVIEKYGNKFRHALDTEYLWPAEVDREPEEKEDLPF